MSPFNVIFSSHSVNWNYITQKSKICWSNNTKIFPFLVSVFLFVVHKFLYSFCHPWSQESSSMVLLLSPNAYCSPHGQANKSRDRFLGLGMETLSRKPADWEDGRIASQVTILSELEFRLLSYKKGRGRDCLLQTSCVWILCSCFCPRMSSNDVPANVLEDKCYSLFCNFQSLYEQERVIPLKVRPLRMGCPV